MAKSSRAEVARRVELLFVPVLNGLREAQIRPYAAAHEWEWMEGLSSRQLRRYVERARDLVEEAAQPGRQWRHRQALARMDDQYALARSQQDVHGAIEASREICKLADAYAPIRVNITDARERLKALLRADVRGEAPTSEQEGTGDV
jgi:hypothetical protein